MSRLSLTPVNIPALATAPTTPTLRTGDMYFNTGDGKVYTYNGSAWAVTGVQGVQGTTGSQGTQGLQGRQGLQGTTGIQGLQGITGDDGFVAQDSAPANTSLLWLDTDEVAVAAQVAVPESLNTVSTGGYFDGTGFRVYGGGFAASSVSTPDSAALDITGDIDIRTQVAATDWTPVFNTSVVGKWSGTQQSYAFYVNSSGLLEFKWSTTGADTITKQSTVSTGLTDGSTKWIRVTLDIDNGASGNDVKFFTSDNGTTWTQLGSTVTTAGVTSIFSSTSTLEIGANQGGTNFAGTFYRTQVRNGIDGTVVFDANYATASLDSFTFTESSSNAATVTLTTPRYSFGIPGKSFTALSTSGTPSTNSDIYSPFRVTGTPITLKHIAYEITSAPASTSTMYIGIYAADNNMQPTGAPLYASSAISISTTGTGVYRVFITPVTLTAGQYLIAYNMNVSATFRTVTISTTSIMNTFGASSVRTTLNGPRNTAAFTSSPTPWSTGGTSSGNTNTTNFLLLGWT
jgi:hypothetical protein